jgi:AAA15 family ATPase/GTPase
MLISFTVGNYLSFNDKMTFSMEATAVREFRDTNTFESVHPDISILRGAALYGPNSSGKSNLLKAIQFMSRFVLNSAKGTTGTEELPDNRFKLSTATSKKPSYFKMEFMHAEQIYIYEFEFDNKEIIAEQLIYKRKVTSAPIFSRKKNKIEVGEKFKSGNKAIEYTRSNALFLSTASLLNVDWAMEIIKAFQKFRFLHIRVPHNMALAGLTSDLFDNKQYRKQIDKLLAGSNLGFNKVTDEVINIQPETSDSRKGNQSIFFSESKIKLIFTLHDQLDEKGNIKSQIAFSLDEESDGTKKYFSMIGPIVETLAEGTVLIVDEFTSHLHPILAEHLIKLFHNSKINKGNGQLIIATHNTYLLNEDLYRKDQIYFIEKDTFYSTRLKRLSDPEIFKDVRQETNFEKRYIHDRQLGALPKWMVEENKFWN